MNMNYVFFIKREVIYVHQILKRPITRHVFVVPTVSALPYYYNARDREEETHCLSNLSFN